MTNALTVQIDLDKAATYSKEQIREYIAALEDQIKDGPQIEIPTEHFFGKSCYGRQMTVEAGSLIIGKIHKFECINVISEGRASVISQDGVMVVEAPFTFVSSPGAKRVIIAYERLVWTTFHGTDERDVQKIEDEFIAKSYADVPAMDALNTPQTKEETLCLS